MNLKEKRLSKGLTTKEVSSMLGICKRQLERIENDKTKKPLSLERACKMAEIYEITVAELRQLEGWYERRYKRELHEDTKDDIK